MADPLLDAVGYVVIGQATHHPVAVEAALKLKEIRYKHAEGVPAGERNHGPLALVSADTPVFAIVTGDDEQAVKTIGNVKEVQARDTPVVTVTADWPSVTRYADYTREIPATHPAVAPVAANLRL